MDFADLSKMKDMLASAQSMQAEMEQKLSETVVEADSGGGAGDGADERAQGGVAAEDRCDGDGLDGGGSGTA